MIDVIGNHAADHEPDSLDVPGEHGYPFFSVQAQDRALGHDAQFLREVGHALDSIKLFRKQVPTEGLDTLIQFYIQGAAGRHHIFETVKFRVFPVPRQGFQLDRCRLFQNLRSDL